MRGGMAGLAMAFCDDCLEGPRGIAGHPGLVMDTLGGRAVIFKCPACRAFWTRAYQGDGEFVWAPLPHPPETPAPTS